MKLSEINTEKTNKKHFFSVIIDDPSSEIPKNVHSMSFLMTEKDFNASGEPTDDFMYMLVQCTDHIPNIIVTLPFELIKPSKIDIKHCMTLFLMLVNVDFAILPPKLPRNTTDALKIENEYVDYLISLIGPFFTYENCQNCLFPISSCFQEILEAEFIKLNPIKLQKPIFMRNGFWPKPLTPRHKKQKNRICRDIKDFLIENIIGDPGIFVNSVASGLQDLFAKKESS